MTVAEKRGVQKVLKQLPPNALDSAVETRQRDWQHSAATLPDIDLLITQALDAESYKGRERRSIMKAIKRSSLYTSHVPETLSVSFEPDHKRMSIASAASGISEIFEDDTALKHEAMAQKRTLFRQNCRRFTEKKPLITSDVIKRMTMMHHSRKSTSDPGFIHLHNRTQTHTLAQ